MVEVREGRLGKSLFATRTLEKGTVILRGWGQIVPRRTRHSLQVDRDKHVVIRTEIELINHSCDPNCGVLVRLEDEVLEIHALRRIEAGEELNTDYATFESDIEHFKGPCQCGAAICRGVIEGYASLPEDRRAALEPYIAKHLRELELPAVLV